LTPLLGKIFLMREALLKIDLLILAAAFLLVALSLLMIFSTSVTQTGTDWSFFVRQLIYSLVGMTVFFIVSLTDYRMLARYSPFFYCLLLGLLIITFFIGTQTRGSVRWIDLKFFTLQASEFAKPILVLFLAHFLTNYPPAKKRHFLFSLLLAAIPILLIMKQPDLGSSIILGVIWISLAFVASTPLIYLAIATSAPLASFPFLWNFLKGYQQERILSFLNPTADPLGKGYNLVQAIIAVGSGGFFGRGLGRGTQSHLNFLPEQKTDFIFATLAEELGFFGVVVLLGLFAVIIWRLFSILGSSKDNLGSYLLVGVIATLLSQIFINVGMNLGILPITGITLPLVSFGGSSIVATFALLGLAQSVQIVSKRED